MMSSFGDVDSVVEAIGAGPKLPARRLVWSLRLLCVAAIVISSYLAWTAFSMTPVYGCSAGDIIDCGHVLKSKWSRVFGMPVSVPAIGLYASLLTLLGFSLRQAPASFHKLLWNGITIGGLMAGCAALWFIGLQVFVLKHLCPWCLAVHSCGLIISGLLIIRGNLSLPRKSLLTSIAGVAVAVMAGIQMATPEADHFTEERFDTAAVDRSAISSEYQEFLGSDGVFEAPIDDAPVEGELFEAPLDDESLSESSDSPADGSAVESDSPAVTSTLLTIVPIRFSCLLRPFALFLQDEATSDAATKATDDSATGLTDKTTPGTTDAAATDTSTAGVTQTPAEPKPREVTVSGNKMTLRVTQWPLLGSPDAKYLFVEMFDYTCPHCRNTHKSIKGAFEHYGKDLAIVVLPVPLEASCNRVATGAGHAGACELAKIAVTVWRADATKFREFHDWIFDTQATPTSARRRAEELVGKEKFARVYASKTPGEYIKRHVDLYEKVGKGSVPKLLFPKATMSGEVGSKTSLCNMIERELGGAATP